MLLLPLLSSVGGGSTSGEPQLGWGSLLGGALLALTSLLCAVALPAAVGAARAFASGACLLGCLPLPDRLCPTACLPACLSVCWPAPAHPNAWLSSCLSADGCPAILPGNLGPCIHYLTLRTAPSP